MPSSSDAPGLDFTNLLEIEKHVKLYKGEFANGQRHGAGELQFINGDRFAGTWRNGLAVEEGKIFREGRGGGEETGVWTGS